MTLLVLAGGQRQDLRAHQPLRTHCTALPNGTGGDSLTRPPVNGFIDIDRQASPHAGINITPLLRFTGFYGERLAPKDYTIYDQDGAQRIKPVDRIDSAKLTAAYVLDRISDAKTEMAGRIRGHRL
jgi:hypothetical protein